MTIDAVTPKVVDCALILITTSARVSVLATDTVPAEVAELPVEGFLDTKDALVVVFKPVWGSVVYV